MIGKPAIILVHTQLDENIGSVARAAANFGFHDLRLVTHNSWEPSYQATRIASHGSFLLDKIKQYPSVQEACGDLMASIAFTRRKRDFEFIEHDLENMCEYIQNLNIPDTPSSWGMVFGKENNGLDNKDLSYMNAIVGINTDEACPSINLAHSVAIACYEITKHIRTRENKIEKLGINKQCVKMQEIYRLVDHIVLYLERAGFFKTKEKKSSMVISLRNIFTKAPKTQRELGVLYGMVNCLAETKKNNF